MATAQHVSRISHQGLQCLSIFCMMICALLQMQVKTSKQSFLALNNAALLPALQLYRAPSANSSSTCSASNVSSHSDKPMVQPALASTTPAMVQQPPLRCEYPSKNEVLILSHAKKNRLRVLAVLHSRFFETPKRPSDFSIKCFTLQHHGIRKQETPRRCSIFQTLDLKGYNFARISLKSFFS